jgi:dephospho-CoA kinase
LKAKVLKVGITGGIGSGKSVVCQIFEILGIPIYYADERAKYLVNTSLIVRSEIIKVFGKDSYSIDGYNRKYMADIVFHDAEQLAKLNNIIHPQVAIDFERWLSKQQSVKYILKEAAILIESEAYKMMDRIIVVDAPIELRINRIKERNHASEEEIRSRMSSQWTADKIKSFADWIIINDDHKMILPQILSIHNQLLNLVFANG